MTSPISNKITPFRFPLNTGELFMILSGIIIVITTINMFQDFWEAKRSGYSFHFSESLLFKIVWILYIPIIMVLYQKLKSETHISYTKTALFIILPITVHLIMLPFIATILSLFFYQGRYDLFKFFSYTLTHDFFIAVLIYAGFVLCYQYLPVRKPDAVYTEKATISPTFVIHNGKDNVIIHTEDIIQITSATPYVSIHLENKRYLHSETLKSMLEQLDDQVFIRVHKSAVVNLSKIRSFKSRLNGDYDLQMTDGTLVRLSRTYASEFKKRFTTGTSGQLTNSSG
ncbi:LytTR family DNA-binding domain-containing protein [Chryseobacterium sp.]|uniref:LytTR family DNA-binding domain-containing protein n=1 Tax=Chryseobacterium sp. TaxID=1871047 RepID=UPI0028967A1C|nr:LytTR family DNA-binding domain-containing protein [Chryseobacterium sp.]